MPVKTGLLGTKLPGTKFKYNPSQWEKTRAENVL